MAGSTGVRHGEYDEPVDDWPVTPEGYQEASEALMDAANTIKRAGLVGKRSVFLEQVAFSIGRGSRSIERRWVLYVRHLDKKENRNERGQDDGRT